MLDADHERRQESQDQEGDFHPPFRYDTGDRATINQEPRDQGLESSGHRLVEVPQTCARIVYRPCTDRRAARPCPIRDATLRDVNHEVPHQILKAHCEVYCAFAHAAGLPIVKVGHDNGLGTSSMLMGECALTAETILTTVPEPEVLSPA